MRDTSRCLVYLAGLLAGLAPLGALHADDVRQAAEAIADDAPERRADGAPAAAAVDEPAELTPQQRERVRDLVDHADEVRRDAFSAARGGDSADTDNEAIHYRIFVSRAMGWDNLTRLFERVAGRDDVTVVFRGIPEGATIDAALRELGRRTRDIEPRPPIRIHPPAFTGADVRAVPTITASRDGEVIARATGSSSVREIERRLAARGGGDYGQLGRTFEISEPNLIAVMKARAAQLDTDALRERARASYWDGARFQHLEVADEARERCIDATITVQRDITTPDGDVVARAGDEINPLAMRPFDRRVVVFDATDDRQLRAAEALADGPGRLVYLATAFDAERGWDHYREVADRLDHRVYKLNKTLRQRFALERVPAVVTATDEHFVVREVPAERYADTETGGGR